MDPITKAKAWRARGLLEEVAGAAGPSPQEKAIAFSEAAFALMKCTGGRDAREALERSSNPLVQKAATSAHLLGDDEWGDGSVADLAAAYLQSVAEESLLDQLARYATVIPPRVQNPLIASAGVSDVVAEGDPKPVRRQGLELADDVSPTKSAALLVLSQELMNSGGEAVRRLFENELQKAVTRGSNRAVLDQLIDSSTLSAPDLATAMKLAGSSMGYVVALNASEVASMAANNTNPASTLGVRGGTLCPGIHIVAIDDLERGVVIPASRLSLRDWGLQVRGAGHASVQMVTDPQTGATELVSLWQNNCYGLLCERSFFLSGDFSGVVVIESQS